MKNSNKASDALRLEEDGEFEQYGDNIDSLKKYLKYGGIHQSEITAQIMAEDMLKEQIFPLMRELGRAPFMIEFVDHRNRVTESFGWKATFCKEKNETAETQRSMTSREAATREIENNFSYHPPKDGQPLAYEAIRGKGKSLAMEILDRCPDSREKDAALMKAEESVMWANAAIARNT